MLGMKVICSRFNEGMNWIEVVREITNDDGSIEYNGLSLPIEKLEFLCAEYEIEDLDELVEFAIYESLMPVDDTGLTMQAARAQKRSRLANAKQRLGNMIPSESKAALKARLQTAGLPAEFVRAVDDDPIEVIKQNSRMDPEIIIQKRDYVRAIRKGENRAMKPSPTPKASTEVRSKNVRPAEVILPPVVLSGGKRVPNGKRSI